MLNGPPHLKKDWVLTQEAFEQLLTHLDADRERAGEKYESLRGKLVKFFEWRGCQTPEENADETFNRVTRRILEGEEIENLQGYFYGVARLLYMETLKNQEKMRRTLDRLPPPVHPEEDDPELGARLACFEECLDRLPEDERKVLMEYYQEDKRAKIENRKKIAERLRIPLNALRIRMHRLRLQLEECVRECLRQPTAELK